MQQLSIMYCFFINLYQHELCDVQSNHIFFYGSIFQNIAGKFTLGDAIYQTCKSHNNEHTQKSQHSILEENKFKSTKAQHDIDTGHFENEKICNV